MFKPIVIKQNIKTELHLVPFNISNFVEAVCQCFERLYVFQEPLYLSN